MLVCKLQVLNIVSCKVILCKARIFLGISGNKLINTIFFNVNDLRIKTSFCSIK